MFLQLEDETANSFPLLRALKIIEPQNMKTDMSIDKYNMLIQLDVNETISVGILRYLKYRILSLSPRSFMQLHDC